MITSKAEYLLAILVDLANQQPGAFTVTRDIADRQKLPAKYLPQLMALLTRKGWVESARGAGGGVRLVVDPEDVTVKDVIDVSEDRFLVKACVDESFECPRKEGCAFHPIWMRAQESVDAVMRSTSLADLVARREGLG